MKRWEFKAGCILLGWGAVEAALELKTSPGTVHQLMVGDLDDVLKGRVVSRAKEAFERSQIGIHPTTNPED